MSTTTHSFEESKKYCNKINGSMVSSVLGSKGKEYHRYDNIEFLNLCKTSLKWFEASFIRKLGD